MACLANNRRMQQLARKFDAELSFDFGSVVGEVAAPRPTPLSMVREMVVDGHGFATAVLDVQSRLLKPAICGNAQNKANAALTDWLELPPILHSSSMEVGSMAVVHAAEIRVLGPSAIEDYHAHLLRLDRTSRFPAADDRSIDTHCLGPGRLRGDPDRRLRQGRDARRRRDRARPHRTARRCRHHRRGRLHRSRASTAKSPRGSSTKRAVTTSTTCACRSRRRRGAIASRRWNCTATRPADSPPRPRKGRRRPRRATRTARSARP